MTKGQRSNVRLILLIGTMLWLGGIPSRVVVGAAQLSCIPENEECIMMELECCDGLECTGEGCAPACVGLGEQCEDYTDCCDEWAMGCDGGECCLQPFYQCSQNEDCCGYGWAGTVCRYGGGGSYCGACTWHNDSGCEVSSDCCWSSDVCFLGMCI
jgi:hypothetical protein